MTKFVDAQDLNQLLIIKETGCCDSNEYFYVFKCPSCQKIFLLEYEFGGIFVEPANLSNFFYDDPFYCTHCQHDFSNQAITGEKADDKYRVTFDELKQSEWRWVLNCEADHNYITRE